MSGFMKTVLKNLNPITFILPCFNYSFRPPPSHIKRQKKGKDGNERKINGYKKKKRTEFPFNCYIVTLGDSF